MAIKIHTAERISKVLTEDQLNLLIQEFTKYWETGKFRPYFGRDYPFDYPNSALEAELSHIHVHPNILSGAPVNASNNLLKRWRLNSSDQRHVTSDTWLIYCQGQKDWDNVLFVAFWKERAHEYGNKTTLVGMLADEAIEFRKRF